MADSFTFIGNATTLIRLGPFTLLTDPNFLHAGERAHLGYGLTSRRLLEPALRVDALPPLDAVVLSHRHGDHWDRVARSGLDRTLPVLTTRQAALLLRRVDRFPRATGLATWQQHTLHKDGAALTVTALPGRHAPGPLRFLLPAVMGSLLELADGDGAVSRRIYLTGDTLMFGGVDEIARRCPDVHVAVLHLGGTTLPGGLMVTMDGQQGADLLELVRPRTAIPVHFEDYTVFRSPLGDFRDQVERRGLADRVRYVGRGETVGL